MENKKTFGAYILQRRKELGMTQKEFAGKLFVTESAVSKWERGLSYPDITLLQNICSVLEISEHELLTASEDTQKRSSEKLAEKYLRLTRNYRLAQYLIYGLTLLGCAVGNIAAQHRLDWFFIVFAAVLMAASFTLLPSLAATRPKLEPYAAHLALASFTASLELLLLVCCLYTGGSWFAVAGLAVLFGLSLILLPFVLPTLPLPPSLASRKASVYLLVETALLLLLLLACCLYSGGAWFPMAAVSLIFGLSLFITPVLLKQFPLPEPLPRHRALIYFVLETVLLLLLLFTANIYTGANTFLTVSLPVALLCLTLPWGIMAAIRYLPVSPWHRAAVCTAWIGLWTWLAPLFADRISSRVYGESTSPYSLRLNYDFSRWGDMTAINVVAIVLFSLAGMTLIFTAVGFLTGKKKRK